MEPLATCARRCLVDRHGFVLRLHAVGDEAGPFRDIAKVIGCNLDLPAASVAADEVGPHFGFLGAFVGSSSWPADPSSIVSVRRMSG